MRLHVLRAGAVCLLLAGCGGDGGGRIAPSPNPPAPPPPPPAAVEPRFTGQPGFASPVLMVQAPNDDTRWFIVEQRGVVRVFDNDAAASSAADFMDIANRVAFGGEGGLLGFAFHPDFAANNFVFASYTAANPFRSVLSRFQVASGGTVDPGTEAIVIEIPQPEGNHNGGHIAIRTGRLSVLRTR